MELWLQHVNTITHTHTVNSLLYCSWHTSFSNLFTLAVMHHIKSPRRSDMLCTHGHSGSQLVSKRASIKVCATHFQAVLEIHTEWPGAQAAERVGAVAYRCSVSHSSCWSYSEVSAQEDRELRHSGIETEWNMRSHSKPCSPQHLKLLAQPKACEQTSSQHKSGWGGGATWWLIWIALF